MIVKLHAAYYNSIKMKIFIASFGTETNTFSPIPTSLNSFQESTLFYGDGTAHSPAFLTAPLHVWKKMAADSSMEIVESISADAQPAGPVVQKDYEELRDCLLQDLQKALPVDLVLLSMHGAMVSQECDDCEGDILEKTREIVGEESVIGAELDLHCHISARMLKNATALITFKEYPHIDTMERACELFLLCQDTYEKKVYPVTSVFETRIIQMWRTPLEPMKSFVARMQEMEGKNGVLSISFGHGFAWGDVPDLGGKVLVITDNNAEYGKKLAEKLGSELWDMRLKAQVSLPEMDEALDIAMAESEGPIVLADVSDNAGGGAPSDSTFLLEKVLERKTDASSRVLSGCYWDPISVNFCIEAGIGATMDLRIGGKCGPFSGNPVDLRITVRGIRKNATQPFGDAVSKIGNAVWVSARGIDLVLNSLRCQVFHPQVFTGLGIKPEKFRIIIVKSTQHFYTGFASMAKKIIYVKTPGAVSPDFSNIPYQKFREPYWPKNENPFVE
jgi:microcystin degradation protein MlrC